MWYTECDILWHIEVRVLLSFSCSLPLPLSRIRTQEDPFCWPHTMDVCVPLSPSLILSLYYSLYLLLSLSLSLTLSLSLSLLLSLSLTLSLSYSLSLLLYLSFTLSLSRACTLSLSLSLSHIHTQEDPSTRILTRYHTAGLCESWHIWVMAHTSHGTYESWHTRGLAHMSHVTYACVNESCHKCDLDSMPYRRCVWVMAHMSHVIYECTNELWHQCSYFIIIFSFPIYHLLHSVFLFNYLIIILLSLFNYHFIITYLIIILFSPISWPPAFSQSDFRHSDKYIHLWPCLILSFCFWILFSKSDRVRKTRIRLDRVRW